MLWITATIFLSAWSLQMFPFLSQIVFLSQATYFDLFIYLLILHSLSREISPPFLISSCFIMVMEHWLKKWVA